MGEFEELKQHKDHFLTKVDIQADNSQLAPSFLRSLLQPVSESRSVGEMHSSIVQSVLRLGRLNTFRRCSVKVLPGEEEDQALVEYHFQLARRWALNMAFVGNFEGGSVKPSMFVKNIRGLADRTTAFFEYKPNTRTWDFGLEHVNPAFVPDKWALAFNVHHLRQQRDLNLTLHQTGCSAALIDVDEAHTVRVGMDVRTSYPRIDYCSLDTLKEGVLTSEKYYLIHTLKSNSLNSGFIPTAGHLAFLSNELAVGQGLKQHSLYAEGRWFYALYRSLTLEVSGKWKWLVPWDFSETHFIDRIRANYVKGFRSVGERKDPADSTLAAHFDAPGDNVGATNVLALEAKLHFHNTPILHFFDISPFIYANLFGVNLDPYQPRSNFPRFRGSAGLGFDFYTRMGRVEISYAAKIAKRSGDIAADFQILFFTS